MNLKKLINQSNRVADSTTTQTELLYLMKYYGINKITLREGGKSYGNVLLQNDKVVYDYKNALWRFNKDEYAFEMALEMINADKKGIEKFISNSKKIYETTVFHTDYDRPEYNRTLKRKDFMYDSDIIDSGVKVDDDGVVRGNINQLRKFLSYTNNHNRYVRSAESYTNQDVVDMLKIGNKYGGLFEKYDSFGEYYHNSIVD